MSGPKRPPRFDEPWHAQVFALTVALNEAGAFSWPDWAQALGESLSRRRVAEGALDGGDDYFLSWLDALERLLAERGAASPPEVEAMREAWRAAYLETPHGQPVTLAAAARD